MKILRTIRSRNLTPVLKSAHPNSSPKWEGLKKRISFSYLLLPGEKEVLMLKRSHSKIRKIIELKRLSIPNGHSIIFLMRQRSVL
jgi:hypothetical protein